MIPEDPHDLDDLDTMNKALLDALVEEVQGRGVLARGPPCLIPLSTGNIEADFILGLNSYSL